MCHKPVTYSFMGLSDVVVFLVGLSAGSFLNVLVDRFNPDKEEGFLQITSGRSKCDGCGRKLGITELVPVLGYLIQKGRSQCCNEKLSLHYPLIELLMGGFFVFMWYFLKDLLTSLYTFEPNMFVAVVVFWFLFSVFLVALARIDFKTYFLPDFLIIPGTLLAFLYVLLLSSVAKVGFYEYGAGIIPASFASVFGSHLLGALLFSGALFLVYAISRGEAMGFGDVKLGVFGGLILGAPYSFLAVFLSFIVGALVGVILLGLRRKKMRDMIPFGPFIVFGIFLAFFFGEWILSWYFGLINI